MSSVLENVALPRELTIEQHRRTESMGLNEDLRSVLRSRRLLNYRWFRVANARKALEYARAIVLAIGAERPDMENLFSEFLDDLYHRDRADRVASLLPNAPLPVRALLPRITCGHQSYDLQLMILSEVPVNIPLDVRWPLARIAQWATPDEFLLGSYVNRNNEKAFSFVCGLFGRWYAEIAVFD